MQPPAWTYVRHGGLDQEKGVYGLFKHPSAERAARLWRFAHTESDATKFVPHNVPHPPTHHGTGIAIFVRKTQLLHWTLHWLS